MLDSPAARIVLPPALLLIAALGGANLSAAPSDTDAAPSARERVAEAHEKIRGALRGIPPGVERGYVLARLAWPPRDSERDPWLEYEAHRELIAMGFDAISVLDEIVDEVDPVYSGDVVLTIKLTKLRSKRGRPRDFYPAMDRALWFGSRDARRLAIRELANGEFYGSLQAVVDVGLEDPALLRDAIRAMAAFRRDSARHFLKTQLESGDPERARLAAESLAAIGGRARDTLREATLDPEAEVRTIALDAWLPMTGTSDLTALYEYLAEHPEDDPERIRRVTERAVLLETLLERQQAAEAEADN